MEPPTKTPQAEGLFFKMLLAMLLLMTTTMITSLLIANGFRKSLNELRRGAARFAKGELRKKLNVTDDAEIGELGQQLNEMAALLNQRFENLENQRSERETILSSMEEGFMAFVFCMGIALSSAFSTAHLQKEKLVHRLRANISKLMQTQQVLEFSEEKYRQLVENSAELNYVQGSNGNRCSTRNHSLRN